MLRGYLKVLPICLFTLLTACMKDKGGECEGDGSSVRLDFVYDLHNRTGVDRFSDEVEHLHLFVYDPSDALVKELSIPTGSLENGRSVELPLNPGSYRIVAWGNIHTEHFAAENVTKADRMAVRLDCVENGVVSVAKPGTLFHGITQVDVSQRQSARRTVEMTNLSCLIRVRIEGLDDPDNTDLITRVTGTNGLFSSDRSIHPDAGTISFVSHQWTEDEFVWEELQIYALSASDRLTRLRIECPDNAAYGVEEALVPILLKKMEEGDHEQTYLDRLEEFTVYVNYNTDGTVTVSVVDPWDDVGNETGIGQ